jgi:hypothetical protein
MGRDCEGAGKKTGRRKSWMRQDLGDLCAFVCAIFFVFSFAGAGNADTLCTLGGIVPPASHTLGDNGMARLTEYDVRDLDAHGDALDVNCFDTLSAARAYAERIAPDRAAVVIERHDFIATDDEGVTDSRYTKVWTTGSAQALREGGWIA